MTWVAAAIVGTGLITSYMSSNAAQSAAQTQANAANNASSQQLQMFNTINQQQAPYRQAGYTALGQIGDFMGPNGTGTHQFNASDLNSNLAPNYAFMLGQGQGAANNANNATGGLMSGNAMKGLEDYTQNYAQNAYQQAYQNYNANQTNIFNRLASIAGIGQTANQSTANAGQSAANAAGQYGTSAAAAQAAGTIGSANAISGGLNSLGSIYMANNLTGGGLLGGGGGSSPGTATISDMNSWMPSGAPQYTSSGGW